MESIVHRHPYPLPVGTRIGVYQLKEVIATKWLGPRYLAWNHHVGAYAVIQEYLPHGLALRADDGLNVVPRTAEQEADFQYGLDRFLEESEILIGIEHPGVVRTDCSLHAHGTLYRAMEHTDGRALAELCSDQSAHLEERDLYSLTLQLLEALMRVHDEGYIHGAVSPAAVVRKANGDAVLTEFAWGQLALAARLQTLPEVLVDGYAAPEQYDPLNPPHVSVDLYALGATLYRCVTQHTPVSAVQRRAAQQRGAPDPQPQISLDPTLTAYAPALLKSIDSMMSLDSEDRPPSARAVHHALRPPPADTRATDKLGETIRTPTQPSRLSPSTRRRATPWILTAGLACAGLAAVAFSLRISETQQPPAGPLDESQPVDTSATTHEPAHQHTEPGIVAFKPSTPSAGSSKPLTSGKDTMAVAADTDPTVVSEEPAQQSPTTTDVRPKVGTLASLEDSALATKEPSTEAQETTGTEAFVDPNGPQEEALSAEVALNDPILDRHFNAAQEHIAALRLTTPPGANAYEHLQAVRALAPEHPKIREAIKEIIDRYSWLIRKALTEGKLKQAQLYLERAERVSPTDPALEGLRLALGSAQFDASAEGVP